MRDTLQRAIYSGTRRVHFADRLVEYNSIAASLAARRSPLTAHRHCWLASFLR